MVEFPWWQTHSLWISRGEVYLVGITEGQLSDEAKKAIDEIQKEGIISGDIKVPETPKS